MVFYACQGLCLINQHYGNIVTDGEKKLAPFADKALGFLAHIQLAPAAGADNYFHKPLLYGHGKTLEGFKIKLKYKNLSCFKNRFCPAFIKGQKALAFCHGQIPASTRQDGRVMVFCR
jgi:hypothetical protein